MVKHLEPSDKDIWSFQVQPKSPEPIQSLSCVFAETCLFQVETQKHSIGGGGWTQNPEKQVSDHCGFKLNSHFDLHSDAACEHLA